MAKQAKKKKIIGCEIEVLTTEVEARKCVLFGGLSTGISNKSRSAEWKTSPRVVDSVGFWEKPDHGRN